jgi:hypothetical protein
MAGNGVSEKALQIANVWWYFATNCVLFGGVIPASELPLMLDKARFSNITMQ